MGIENEKLHEAWPPVLVPKEMSRNQQCPGKKMTKSSQEATAVLVKKQSWVNGRTTLLMCSTTFRKFPYYPNPSVFCFVFTSTTEVVIKAYTCDGGFLLRSLKSNTECLVMLDDLEKREQIKY